MNSHPYPSARWPRQQLAPDARAGRATHYLPLLALLALLLPGRSWGQCTQLVWQDEFNDTAVDTTKWKFVVGDGCDTGNCGFGNAEQQQYLRQNASVAGGSLVISTKYEATTAPSGRSYKFTSAKLLSKLVGSGKLQTFRYGRMEARIQLPSAGGVWPAFWMMPTPSDWPSTGEIDILEAKHKNPSVVTGTAIGKGPSGTAFMSRQYQAGTDLSAGYHVYALEWSPDELRFYVDGNLYNTVTPQTSPAGAFPFNDNRFYLILNAAVGGTNTGYTGKIAPTPADYPTQMLVDYVRVYGGTYNYGILGDAAVYQGDQYKTYRIEPIAGASYAWTVPSGATLVSGQGTNTITVNWGTKPGNLAVTATVNGCPTATYTKAVTMSAPLVLDQVLEDFESNRVVTYASYSGTFNQAAANPGPAAPNTSATVGKYLRDPRQYDVINLRNFPVTNANDFVTGRKKVYLDVYSSAPVGSRLTLQFENSAMTAGKAYPTGRHSAYKAFTTKQNAWETLEFDFEKVVDKNVGNLDVDNVLIMTEPAVYSNATYYLDNLLVKTRPTTVLATDVLENYDGSSRLTLQSAAGNYAPGTANPAPAAPNTSATVARYVRNPNQQYDGLVFGAGAPGSVITNAAKLKSQDYQLQVDVYTDAPVGTPVSVNLQNQAAAAGAYPAGRNSTYLARTTRQNQWETLTLQYNTTPDGGSSNLSIDQLVLLFNANSYTGHTYYLDNLRVVKYVADPVYTAGQVLENYDDARNLSLLSADGTYQPVQPNPAASPANPSANVGRYDRKGTATYDALVFGSSQLTDGAAYKAGDKAFAMDVYTTAPAGTLISCQLESSALSRADNYPGGRHSIYQAVVQQPNAWNNLVFTYTSTPDASTTDADVDKLVFLFRPNSSTSDVYYIDNIRSLRQVTNAAPTVSLTGPADGASYTSPASLTLTANAADSDGTVSKVEFYNGSTLLGTDTSSPYSYAWSGVAAGTYTLTAKATDDQGAVTTSAPVTVTVTAPPVNLALNKRAVSSGNENSSLVPAKAVDGSTSTRWSSAYADNQWLYVDLGASYNLNRVKITWYSAASAGKDYALEVSTDSTNWTAIKSVTGNTALTNDWTGLGGSGRFLRMRGITRSGRYGYSIYELEAYGTAATAARLALATAAPAAKTPAAGELGLYPNPVTAGVTLTGLASFPAEVSEYDTRGALLRQHHLAQASEAEGLDWSGLPAGLYLLRATSGGTSQTLRFVKH